MGGPKIEGALYKTSRRSFCKKKQKQPLFIGQRVSYRGRKPICSRGFSKMTDISTTLFGPGHCAEAKAVTWSCWSEGIML